VRSYLCVKTVALFLLLSFSVIGLGQSPVIEITGADEALAANIRGHLSIHGEACDTPMARLERLRGQVRENASRAGQALGYYQLSSEPRFSAGDSCWHLVLVITPGERVRVHEVSIHLSESYEKNLLFQEILALLGLEKGQGLTSTVSAKLGLDTVAFSGGTIIGIVPWDSENT